MADALMEAVEGVIASMPQVRNFQHESLGHEPTPVEFVPDVEIVGDPAVRRLHGRGAGGSVGVAAVATHGRRERSPEERCRRNVAGPAGARRRKQKRAREGAEPTPKLNAAQWTCCRK